MARPDKSSAKFVVCCAGAGIVAIGFFLVVVFFATGCTVTPKVVPPPAIASYSGNDANGGLLDLGPNNKGPAHVTASWVAEYNHLIKSYGKDMTPPDKPNAGVTILPDGTYSVDFQHLSDFGVMATMERSGIAP